MQQVQGPAEHVRLFGRIAATGGVRVAWAQLKKGLHSGAPTMAPACAGAGPVRLRMRPRVAQLAWATEKTENAKSQARILS